MAEISESAPPRLPDRTSVKTALAALQAGADAAKLAAALTTNFHLPSPRRVSTSIGATRDLSSRRATVASRSCVYG